MNGVKLINFKWKFKKLVDFEKTISGNKILMQVLISKLKISFSDGNITHLWDTSHREIFKFRKKT